MTYDPYTLPGFVAWSAGWDRPPSLFDYLGVEGGATLPIAFTALFWPRLVEARGCVLLAEHHRAENLDHWWTELDGDIPRIEAVVNALPLADLLDPDIPFAALEHLTQVLQHTWTAALAVAFPDRVLTVTTTTDADAHTAAITFSSR
jgi:hypothetical protein